MNKTNPQGAGTRNVTANLSDALYKHLLRLADNSGVGISTYITCVLVEAAEAEKEFENARIIRLKASNLTSPRVSSGQGGKNAALAMQKRLSGHNPDKPEP